MQAFLKYNLRKRAVLTVSAEALISYAQKKYFGCSESSFSPLFRVFTLLTNAVNSSDLKREPFCA